MILSGKAVIEREWGTGRQISLDIYVWRGSGVVENYMGVVDVKTMGDMFMGRIRYLEDKIEDFFHFWIHSDVIVS
jgi:hypothetical protein